jgi:choline dehydrogenase-like flavoprotein
MQKTEFDVCIIGTGITGSLAADHFLKKGASVAMLERGNNIYFPASKKEYWSESTSKRREGNHLITRNYWSGAEKYFDDLVSVENVHSNFSFNYNMKYGLGGSGAVWSGASWRMTPQDFATKTLYGYGRDWPFPYEELSPYYDNIERIFQTSGPIDETSWPWKNNYQFPHFKQNYLDKVASKILAPEYVVTPSPFSVKNLPGKEGGCIGAKNCVRRCPSNARFRPDTELLYPHLQNPKSDLTLLMDSPCVKLHLSKTQQIDRVDILHQGKLQHIRAKYYFLAANTVENIRILLNSHDDKQGPVANSSGLLGHHFMTHGALAMSVTLDEPVYASRGRPTTSSVINTLNHSRRTELNSYMMELWNYDWSVGSNPISFMNRFRFKERHWGKTLFEKIKEADNRFAATFIFEIEARNRNYISLSSLKDRTGLPLAKVDFKLSKRDRKTFKFLKLSAEELKKRSGVRSIELPGYGLNGNHPLGGYACGNDARTSVVDSWMRSHDHDNLYILGGGSFNSTSALNPTHTIAALTLKALDDPRLKT